MILHLSELGQLHRVLYDKLGSFDRVLGFNQFEASSSRGLSRKKANNRLINGMLRVIWGASQRDDDGALLTHPMTYRYVKFALSLILHQKEPVGLSFLPYCFMPETEQFKFLLNNCTDEQTYRVWKHIEKLEKNPTQKEAQLGGGQRLVETVLDMPEVLARLDGNVDVGALMREGAIVILDGSDAEMDARTAIFRTWQAWVRDELDDNFAETQKPLPCLIIADEAPASRAIGLPELNFMREARKKGGAMWVAGQDLDYLNPQFMRSLKAITPEHVWYRAADDEVAMTAAKDIGFATLDEFAVHHTDRDLKAIEQIEADKVSTTKGDKGKSKTVSKGHELIYGEVERHHYQALDDQIKLKARDALTMGAGHRFIKAPGMVTAKPVYVPMRDDPYPEDYYPGLRRQKIEQAIALSQQRQEFHTPQVELDSSWNSLTTDSDNGGFRRLGRN
jgi:hypothetical protein